jgi:hypothetical protein
VLTIEDGATLLRARTALVPVIVVTDTTPPDMINLGVGPPALETTPDVPVTLTIVAGVALVNLIVLALIPVILVTEDGITLRSA